MINSGLIMVRDGFLIRLVDWLVVFLENDWMIFPEMLGMDEWNFIIQIDELESFSEG